MATHSGTEVHHAGEGPAVDGHDHHEPQSFWTKWVFSQDHKIIGIQYFITGSLVGIFGMVMSGVMRLQLAFPGTVDFLDTGLYYQYMTQHGMIMVIFLLTAVLLGGFGNYLIPLMIGARDMAFPFLNMLSYWVYFLSVLILLSGFFVPGGPTGAGWTLYPPQSILGPGTPGADAGIVVMLVALVFFIAAATMGGLNYVTTVLQMRTRGMTLMRMPLTIWGIFLASVVALFAFPALFVGGVMLLLDNVVQTSFFMPFMPGRDLPYEGGSPILFQHLFWYFGHPEVYIVILPVFGIVSDVISTHARKPIFGYRMMVYAMAFIGVIGFGVWAHHMFASGMNPFFGFFFATTTLVIAIPSAIKVYNWLLTLWKGNLHLRVPMLFAIAFLSTFLIGGLTGLFLGNVVVDLPLHETYFVVGHFHMVMGVAAILGIFAGLYHWWPKVTGKHLNPFLGQIHFWVTFLGSYVVFFPMHHLGIQGLPRRYFDFANLDYLPGSVETLQVVITVAALSVAVAQAVVVVNMVWSLIRGPKAAPNPWKAVSLEWQTPETPAGHGNWGPELPVVHRWAYAYSPPDVEDDFLPQTAPLVTTGVATGVGSGDGSGPGGGTEAGTEGDGREV